MTKFMRAITLSVACLISGSAFGQQYPNKPVKIIIPFPAGGVTDLAGRLIAQKLSERLGQQFYIENIGGAGGNLGMAQVARAPGDGYTVLLSSSSVTVNPSLYNKMAFDVEKDLIPVTKAGGSPNSWLVNPNFPAKNMKDLVELFKKEPGKYSVGSPGAGPPRRFRSSSSSTTEGQLRHRAVRRRRADDAVAARRPRADLLRRDRQLGRPHQGGKNPRARHHRQKAAGDAARHPDARRNGHQRLGSRDHHRRVRARRDAEGDRQSAAKGARS
jgi:Tripartite tricarboxylate transporter family receptor